MTQYTPIDSLTVDLNDPAAIINYREMMRAFIDGGRCPLAGHRWRMVGNDAGYCTHEGQDFRWNPATGHAEQAGFQLGGGPGLWFWERMARYEYLMGCPLAMDDEQS